MFIGIKRSNLKPKTSNEMTIEQSIDFLIMAAWASADATRWRVRADA